MKKIYQLFEGEMYSIEVRQKDAMLVSEMDGGRPFEFQKKFYPGEYPETASGAVRKSILETAGLIIETKQQLLELEKDLFYAQKLKSETEN